MKIRILTATLTAALFIGAAPAHAATTAQAKRATSAELNDRYDHVHAIYVEGCKRLTSTYFRCSWTVRQMYADCGMPYLLNHEGSAYVRFYGRTPDVMLRTTTSDCL